MAFNIGPSGGGGFPDWLKQKTSGNTGITGGMRNRPVGFERPSGGMRPPMNRPQVMPRPQGPSMGRPSGNTPFGMGPMPMPNSGGKQFTPIDIPGMERSPGSIPPSAWGGFGEGIQTPGQQPLEENQLWRTYNRLLGGDKGSMGPRMLL